MGDPLVGVVTGGPPRSVASRCWGPPAAGAGCWRPAASGLRLRPDEWAAQALPAISGRPDRLRSPLLTLWVVRGPALSLWAVAGGV